MKILIFGCGVIGSVYATKFAEAGYDITAYARGNRLKELQERGLLYKSGDQIKKSNVIVTDSIEGIYDYVFVTVKNEQVNSALEEVKSIKCNNIVTMVNNPQGYDEWNSKLGDGRLIPAFPGAGGVIVDGVLDAGLTPAIIQKTTFGEINGKQSKRIEILERIFIRSKIPCEICCFMRDWQLCHLAMVVPMADAIYLDGGDNYTAGNNAVVMQKTANEIKRNLKVLKNNGYHIMPGKMNMFITMPSSILATGLSKIYASSFGRRFIYSHANKARTEMTTLRKSYYQIMKNMNADRK